MMAVDVGGTFTDVVAVKDGRIFTAKVSTRVGEVELGVIEGAAELGAADAPVFNHASTHGLNAIITRSLPKIGFLTTAGHRDILDIGRTWRPVAALTDPSWRRSFGDAARPLVPRYLRRGVRERLKADGSVRDAAPTIPGRRCGDADNIAKAVLDALNGLAFADDADVVTLVVHRRWTTGTPHAVVTVADVPGDALHESLAE